jgi:hypothetical protein
MLLTLDFRRTRFSDDPLASSRLLVSNPLSVPSVTFSVTVHAKCNQILRDIPAELTPRLHVMNLQVHRGTAVLAAPTISLHYLVSDHDVFLRQEFEPGLLLA